MADEITAPGAAREGAATVSKHSITVINAVTNIRANDQEVSQKT